MLFAHRVHYASMRDVLREVNQTRDLIVATAVAVGGVSVAVAVAIWVSVAVSVATAAVCASWAVWAICVGSKLLSELLLLGDGFLDSGLLSGHVILVLLLLGGDELFVLRLLSLHEFLALGLGLVEGLLLGLADLLDLLGGHAVWAIGVRAVATEGGGGTVGSGAVGEGTTVVRGSVGSERHL